jgi:predicted alpha/beta-fold hydrolase
MTTNDQNTFNPPWFLRSALLQTVLASRKIRTRGTADVRSVSREIIFEVDDGVRLQGFYSPPPESNPKGTVVVIHGWEGSAESAYVLCVARHLYANGFGVCRLNLRDHGDTHHLNQGLFYATRLEETHEAIKQIAALAGSGALYLVGFSMGGNFALRIGMACAHDPIPQLQHIAAISPVMNPDNSTTAVDRYPMIRRYFMNKWKRSLRRKEALFPDAYHFTDLLADDSIRRLSERLIDQYTNYPSLADYFAAYTLTGERLQALHVPATIVTARDDPIVPVEDFRGLQLNPDSQLIVHRYGGHSGFVEDLTLTAWHERQLPKLLLGSRRPGSAASQSGESL